VNTASIWDAIDPTSELATQAAPGYDQGEALPNRQTVSAGTPLWSPSHPQFGAGVLLAITAGAFYYAFEHGAGASADAHFGSAHAGAEAELEGAS
jgi:hypothetical protein